MILTNISQSTYFVIKISPLVNACLFKKFYLNLFNKLIVPGGLQKNITEPESKNISDRFFGKIMIDTINLFFFKQLTKLYIKLFRCGKIGTKRLFQNHSCPSFLRTTWCGSPDACRLLTIC